MKYAAAVFLSLALIGQAHSQTLDLREYFPDNKVSIFNKHGGASSARYTFIKAPPGFSNTYYTFQNLNKPGHHYLWRKEYWKDGQWVKSVDQLLYMGDDQSVTETGGWRPSGSGNILIGYAKESGANTGLSWSPPGGIGESAHIEEMKVVQQTSPGSSYEHRGQYAYSKVGLIEYMPTYTPPAGRNVNGEWCAGCSKAYTDVVRLVMYHGTKTATSTQVRCGDKSPISAHGPYYHPFKGYNSYAIELWLAKGVGIIQQNTPFIEDGAYWDEMDNCTGGIFSSEYVWSRFIDEQ